MATTIQLKSFNAKASPVPADIVYLGDSGNSFDEVQSTIAQLIAAYPALSSIAGLTTVANEIIYTTAANTYTTAPITAFSLSVLALAAATTTPTAGLLAGWDANSDLSANNFLSAYATTATAAGTATLVVGSAYNQYFTGSTTQTVVLPVTSTLVLGQSFRIVNNSSGVVTVQSSGANTITAMAANTSLIVTVISTSGTTAASWDAQYFNKSALVLPLSVANGGTGVNSVTIAPAATAWAGWDANKNLSANNHIEGYSTTVTAAGTTTLTVASPYLNYFTGSTTQTVVLPVTSTLVLGQQFFVANNSSGVVTVQSSGGNNIVALAANTVASFTCILTTGTTAASWSTDYNATVAGVNSITGTASQIIASASTGAVTLSLPQSIATSSAVQFASLRLSNTGLLDNNNITMMSLGATANAVNFFAMSNAATTGNPIFQVLGSDTNITMLIAGKGTGAVLIGGTGTNGNALAGFVGEVISNTASGVSLSGNIAANITSISLTAGDWDVMGSVNYVPATGTTTNYTITSISVNSATHATYITSGGARIASTASAYAAPTTRISIASTTTVYLVGTAQFSVSTMTAGGLIYARRRR